MNYPYLTHGSEIFAFLERPAIVRGQMNICILILASAAQAWAGELPEVVVTANRIDTPEAEVATATTVISAREIERSQRSQLSDLLRTVPGLSVSSSGGPGQLTSVSIRGTSAGHALVMIDGVPMNDPLSVDRSFDFGNLSAQDIERVEILRGSQSMLYGSDAIGGVINIITRKGKGPLKAQVAGEYGSSSA